MLTHDRDVSPDRPGPEPTIPVRQCIAVPTGRRGRRGGDVGPLRRNVEHLGVATLRQLLHLDLQFVDKRLHLRAPSTEGRGGHLEGGDAVVALVVEGVDADGL